MTEKDLDIAIEKCERIMEMDTRTMQNPVSENGWIFEKVYELLKYLRQFQFATDTNVGGNLIDRQAAIDALNAMKICRPLDSDRYVISDCMNKIAALSSVQPEPLTDKEQRIFLAAMDREEKVCKQVDDERRDCREPYEDSLVRTCHEIVRKVKGALWT